MSITSIPPVTPNLGKRSRISSSSVTSPSPSSSSSPSHSPETKIARSSTSPSSSPSPLTSSSLSSENTQSTQREIICTLPPTCNHHPIRLANSKELERHYANYHAHVCEQVGCGCVFPEARFLELHQTECHDPLASVRKDRGEKIFGCLTTNCPKLFLTPKARRLHMIEGHKYPKEFFFGVTNKGIGLLLKKWGEGASMIRGEWKPRDLPKKNKNGDVPRESRMVEDNSDEEEEDDEEEDTGPHQMDMDTTPRPKAKQLLPASPPNTKPTRNNNTTAVDVDALADGMTSLSLVPPSVRFGRGGPAGGLGLGARGRARGGRGGIIPPGHQRSASTETEGTVVVNERGRGRGGRGRGRGGQGHRVTASIDSGMNVDGGASGGDVVLVPPSNTGRGRGGRGRGRRGIRGMN